MSDLKDGRGVARAKRLPADVLAAMATEFIEALRLVVREEIRAVSHPSDDWRDQSQSRVLGSRRHIKAVQRRLAEDPRDPYAKRVGDRYYLSTDGIALELERIGDAAERKLKKPTPLPPPAELSPEEEAYERLARKLRGL